RADRSTADVLDDDVDVFVGAFLDVDLGGAAGIDEEVAGRAGVLDGARRVGAVAPGDGGRVVGRVGGRVGGGAGIGGGKGGALRGELGPFGGGEGDIYGARQRGVVDRGRDVGTAGRGAVRRVLDHDVELLIGPFLGVGLRRAAGVHGEVAGRAGVLDGAG